MIEVRTPANQFFDSDGTPLDNGYIYVGTTGANPETTPQTVYWDKAGTIPAAQPIRTINGFPARDGAVSKFYTATKNYSITVKDKRGILVMGVLNSDSGVFDELSASSGAAMVGYDNTTSGMTADDVQEAIDELKTGLTAVENDVEVLGGAKYPTSFNLFANSAFRINTRAYVSGAATTTANQYTIDCVKVVVSGQSLVFTAASDYGFKITAPAGGAEQVIEGNRVVGGDYACTWVGTGTVQINGTSVTKGETFALTAGSNVTVRMVGEIEKIVITRPDMIGRYEYDPIEDSRICSKYARLNEWAWAAGTSTTALSLLVEFDTPMAGAPAVSLVNGTGAIHEPSVIFRDISSVGASSVVSTGGYLVLNSTSIVANRMYQIRDARILFTVGL